jgi:DNA-binding MarR family transcriptional regulator
MENLDFAIRMRNALGVIREDLGADFPSQHLAVLYDIAANPDTSIGEVGNRLGMPSSSISRAVAALSKWSWTKKQGHGLVEKIEDIYESRRKLLRLSQQGAMLVNRMREAFESGGESNAKKTRSNNK